MGGLEKRRYTADLSLEEGIHFTLGKSFSENLNFKTPDHWRDKMVYKYYVHVLKRPGHLGIRWTPYKLIFYWGLSLGLKGSYTDEMTKPYGNFRIYRTILLNLKINTKIVLLQVLLKY